MQEQLLQQILREIQGVRGEMSDLKQDVSTLKQGVGDLKHDVSTLKQDVGDLKQSQNIMQQQLDENTQMLKAILHRQDETDAKLDNLSLDVHKLHGIVTANTQKLDALNDDVAELKKVENKQESTLNILSRRSLEQEEMLRRLNQ